MNSKEKEEINSDITEINRKLIRNHKTIEENNKAIYQIEHENSSYAYQLNKTDQYVSGINSYLGFFSRLLPWNWSSSKKRKNHQIISNADNKKQDQGSIITNPDDEVLNSIISMKKNASKNNEAIKKGLDEYDNVIFQMNQNQKKEIKVKSKVNKLKKSYN